MERKGSFHVSSSFHNCLPNLPQATPCCRSPLLGTQCVKCARCYCRSQCNRACTQHTHPFPCWHAVKITGLGALTESVFNDRRGPASAFESARPSKWVRDIEHESNLEVKSGSTLVAAVGALERPPGTADGARGTRCTGTAQHGMAMGGQACRELPKQETQDGGTQESNVGVFGQQMTGDIVYVHQADTRVCPHHVWSVAHLVTLCRKSGLACCVWLGEASCTLDVRRQPQQG